MILLSGIFVILIIISLFDIIESDIHSRIIVLGLLGLVLVFVASLRFGDRDYDNYLEIYDTVSPLFEKAKSEISHGEPGYILLNRLCKSLGIGSIGVFFIMALSSVTLSLNFFRKHTDFFFIALLVYFSHVFLLRDMLQIRSGLAASISLYAFPYLSRRRFVPFLCIILLAICFHVGAGIILVVYFIFPYIMRKDIRLVYVSVAGYFLGIILTASLLEYFFTKVLYIPGVSLYTGDPDNFKSLGLFNPVLLKSTGLLFILFMYREDLRKKVKYFDAFMVSLCFSIFWLAAFNQFAIFAARLATYLSNTEHILLPALFYTKFNKVALWILVLCYCIFMFISKFETFKDLSFYFLD